MPARDASNDPTPPTAPAAPAPPVPPTPPTAPVPPTAPTPPTAPRPADQDGADERTVQQLDARTMRGLAHPLRMNLLRTLRDFGPATASQLAARLGESSGATSYHLRQLASYGFVEDAPEHGKGRERWWRSAHDGTTYDGSLADSPDPSVRGAADLFIHEVANQHTRDLATWIGTFRDWPQEWRETSTLSDFTMSLTPELAVELGSRIAELIESYRPLGKDAEDTAKYRFHLHGFPMSKD